MTDIKVKRKERKIVLDGHAGYAEIGKDIVCAGISILVATFVMTNEEHVMIIEDLEDHMEMEWDSNVSPDYLLNGLELLANEYPDNARISFD